MASLKSETPTVQSSQSGCSRTQLISALGVTQILAWGSSYYLMAVLARPIAKDTGWPFTWVVGGLSLGLLVAGLVSPRVGRAIETHGGRPVLATSAILLSAGLAGLALATNVVLYLVCWLILGVGMGAGLYNAAFATLGRLYGRNARSAITTLTLWGGFASTICWPLSAFLIEIGGWRQACLFYAGLHLLVVFPLHMLVLPRERREFAKTRDAIPMGADPSITVQDKPAVAGNTAPLFILLAMTLTLGAMITSVVSVHLLTILQARDMALGAAVTLGALVGPSQVGARLLEVLIGRRFHAIWTLIASTVLTAAGLCTLWSGLPLVSAALVLYGAGLGIRSIASGTLPLALFGPSGYPRLMGRLAMPTLVAQSLSPSLGAILIEAFHARGTLAALSVLALLNIGLVFALGLTARRSVVASA
jgi:Major Facilitator Superfamily